jgi:hypothetical protein
MRPKALVPIEVTMVAVLELLQGLVPVYLVVAPSSATAVAESHLVLLPRYYYRVS